MAAASEKADPSSCDSMLSQLQADFAAFCRVRDRLVLVQDDAQLHNILSKLLPRLLRRFDKVCKDISEANYAEEEAIVVHGEWYVRKQMKEELLSIFTYVMDRIHDASATFCNTTSENAAVLSIPWIPQILPLCLETETWVAQAMCLSLTRHGLGQFPREMAQEHGTELVSVSVACLEQVEAISTLHLSHYRQSGWVVLYLLLRMYGIPIVPHRKLEYDEMEISRASDNAVPWEALQATCIDVTLTCTRPGPRFLELVLDVLFFECTNINRIGGISEAGSYRMQRALHWSNNYQRQVQFCVVHTAFYSGIYNNDRRVPLMIAILLAGESSAHGKLATKYLDSIIGTKFVEKGNSAAKIGNRRHMEEAPANGCPLEVACTLLILILGHSQVEPILQRRAVDGDCLHLLGPSPSTEDLYRSPLLGAAHVVDFLAKHLLIETASPAFNLYLELIDAVHEHGQRRGTDCVMKLLKPLFGKLVEEAQEQRDEVVYKRLAQTCLVKAWEVISTVSSTDQRREAFEDSFLDPRTRNQGRRRDHATRLVERHRFWREQDALRLAEAEQSRETAYYFMKILASRNVFLPADPDGSLYTIPTQLFECAMNESSELSIHAGWALDAWCKHCQRFQAECWKRENPEQKQNRVARLLPCLLSAAACSQSEVARMSVVTWCRDFLVCMDPMVALHLCSFLRDDQEISIAQNASAVVEDVMAHSNFRNTPQTKSETCALEFYSWNNRDDVVKLREHLNRAVSTLAREARCADGVAFVLLQTYGFSRDRVFEALLLDRSAALEHCGLSGRLNHAEEICRVDGFTCEICIDDFGSISDGYSLPCGHTFCTSCWRTYLSSAFEGAMGTFKPKCPQHKCSERVIDEDVAGLVPESVERWHHSCLKSFIHHDKHFSNCPGTDCDGVAYRRELVPCETATCEYCRTSFCFDCMSEPHRPAKCGDFAEWKRQFAANSFWMKKKSKPCPNCNVPIEKNEGCNHMKCTQCETDFCWLCLSPMLVGAAHTCNRFEPTDQNDNDSRVVFFTDRFDAHEDGELYMKDRLGMLKSKMESEEIHRMPFVSDEEWDALKEAVETTLQSRRFLKYSYVAVWALHDDQDRRIALENHQATLELVTERLSRLTNINLDRLYEEEARFGIQNHFRSLEFHTLSVQEYIQRVQNII